MVFNLEGVSSLNMSPATVAGPVAGHGRRPSRRLKCAGGHVVTTSVGTTPVTKRGAVGALIKILINAAALWVAVLLLDGLHLEEGAWLELLIIALLLGVANLIVRPILTVLSLPLVLLTLGLFLLVVNAIVLALVIAVSDAFGLGLSSDGFSWTFLGALIVSLVSWALETLLGRR